MLKRGIVLRLLLILFLAAAPALLLVGESDSSLAQDSEDGSEDAQELFVRDLLSKMTVAEKVGQLFMVPFSGSDPDTQSAIADLIVNLQQAQFNIARAG